MKSLSDTGANDLQTTGEKRLPPMLPMEKLAGRPFVVEAAELRPSAHRPGGVWARFTVNLAGTHKRVSFRSDSQTICKQVERLSPDDFPFLATVLLTKVGKGVKHQLIDPSEEQRAFLRILLETEPLTKEDASTLANAMGMPADRRKAYAESADSAGAVEWKWSHVRDRLAIDYWVDYLPPSVS